MCFCLLVVDTLVVRFCNRKGTGQLPSSSMKRTNASSTQLYLQTRIILERCLNVHLNAYLTLKKRKIEVTHTAHEHTHVCR